MTDIWASDLRFVPAVPLVVAGLALALRGGVLMFSALRLEPRAPGKNLRLMRGFRVSIIGLAVAGVAGGWLLQVEALAVAALIIGFGELFESSLDIWALRRQPGPRRSQDQRA